MEKFKMNKSKILLGVSVALISFEVFLGASAGYLTATFLAERWRSLVFNIGNYKFHFHHWLMGFIALILAFISGFTPLVSQFSFGFFGGLIFQGISCYPNWHKILIKKD